MVLEVLDRGRAGGRVPLRVEGEPVALPRLAIALRPEQRTGLGEGEVDVEEDRVDRLRRA